MFCSDLLDSSSPSYTSLPPFTPAYQLNTSLLCGSTSPISTYVFRTVTKLLGTDANIQLALARSSLQEYPFDVYAQILSAECSVCITKYYQLYRKILHVCPGS